MDVWRTLQQIKNTQSQWDWIPMPKNVQPENTSTSQPELRTSIFVKLLEDYVMRTQPEDTVI